MNLRAPLFLLFLFCSYNHLAQQYQFTNYGLNDGLAQSQVYCVEEDSKAYIWMGTNGGGLSRFNGLEFETFSVKEGLSSNYVLSLKEDHLNNLWIGTSKGVNLFKDGQFSELELWESDVKVTAISSFNNGEVWFGTDRGVWILRDSTITELQVPGFKHSGDISFIKQKGNQVWIGSKSGVSKISNNKAVHFDRRAGLSGNLVESISFDTLGGAWIGTYGNGVNYIRNDSISRPLKIFPELNNIVANDLYWNSKGELWIATIQLGICVVNPSDSSYIALNEAKGMANDYVNTIDIDRWGNMWFGTTGGGISKYSGQQFEHFDKNNGLKGNYIYSVCAAGDSLWLTSSAGGLSLFKNGQAIRYGLDSGFTDIKAKTIFQSKDDLIWIGTEGAGMSLFDGDTFTTYTVNDGLGSNWIKSIEEDTLGRIWMATGGGGISRLDGFDTSSLPTFTRYTVNEGLPSNRFIDLHIDNVNRVWFASRSGGLGYIINDSVIKTFGAADSLLSTTVRSIVEDANGNLWIGTNAGINIAYLYNDSISIKSFNGNDLLSSTNIYLLEMDTEGALWVGTEKGVDRLKLEEGTKVLESFHFGDEEGFIGVETNLNASCVDDKGDVWFGTIKGLHRYLSDVNISNNQPPILNFTTVNLDYTPIQQTSFYKGDGQPILLPFDENNLTFDFLGITQTLPKKVRYQWQLKGLENSWSPVSKRRSVNYSNLKPGEYTFLVKSVNESGVWNPNPLEFSFIITKPMWKENWFILSYSSFFVLVLILIITSRVRTVKRKAKARQEKILMEKDLLVLEQKALRLQMNPHFIFHTLNSIQALIATKEEDEAREYLSKFSRLMRQILENSRQNEVSLDTEIETLENYLSIEQFVNDNKFQFELDLGDDLEMEFIKIPPMIIQPFLENAILHGLSHKEAGKGRLKLIFKDLGNILECTIEDNGVGRERSAQHNAVSNKQHKSTAMLVTKERLAFLTGDENSLIIEDLKDSNGAGIGTRVKIKLPIVEVNDA